MGQEGEPLTNPHDPGLLAAYVEGRLDDEERRALTEHLVACADCRQALAMLARAGVAHPLAAKRRRVASPVWLALAASVILATLAVWRLDGPRAGGIQEGPASPGGGSASSRPTPEPHPTTAASSPRASVPADPLQDPGLLVKRGAALRHAGGKAFRLVAGEWVDTVFDPTASLPTTQVKGRDERAAVVQRLPALGPYAALGDRVVVVFEGTVYRFVP